MGDIDGCILLLNEASRTYWCSMRGHCNNNNVFVSCVNGHNQGDVATLVLHGVCRV